jgi:hypothetical protein
MDPVLASSTVFPSITCRRTSARRESEGGEGERGPVATHEGDGGGRAGEERFGNIAPRAIETCLGAVHARARRSRDELTNVPGRISSYQTSPATWLFMNSRVASFAVTALRANRLFCESAVGRRCRVEGEEKEWVKHLCACRLH